MEEKRIPCPYCRELIVEGAQKCRFCGERLGGVSSAGDDRVSTQQPGDGAVSVGHIRSRISFGGLLLGWVVGDVMAFIVASAIGYAAANDVIPKKQAGELVLYWSGFLGALLGGCIAAMCARRQYLLHGLLVGLLCVLGAIMSSIVLCRVNVTASEFIAESVRQSKVLLSWGLTIVGGGLGGLLSPIN